MAKKAPPILFNKYFDFISSLPVSVKIATYMPTAVKEENPAFFRLFTALKFPAHTISCFLRRHRSFDVSCYNAGLELPSTSGWASDSKSLASENKKDRRDFNPAGLIGCVCLILSKHRHSPLFSSEKARRYSSSPAASPSPPVATAAVRVVSGTSTPPTISGKSSMSRSRLA